MIIKNSKRKKNDLVDYFITNLENYKNESFSVNSFSKEKS